MEGENESANAGFPSLRQDSGNNRTLSTSSPWSLGRGHFGILLLLPIWAKQQRHRQPVPGVSVLATAEGPGARPGPAWEPGPPLPQPGRGRPTLARCRPFRAADVSDHVSRRRPAPLGPKEPHVLRGFPRWGRRHRRGRRLLPRSGQKTTHLSRQPCPTRPGGRGGPPPSAGARRTGSRSARRPRSAPAPCPASPAAAARAPAPRAVPPPACRGRSGARSPRRASPERAAHVSSPGLLKPAGARGSAADPD